MQIKMAVSSYHKGGLFITLANLKLFCVRYTCSNSLLPYSQEGQERRHGCSLNLPSIFLHQIYNVYFLMFLNKLNSALLVLLYQCLAYLLVCFLYGTSILRALFKL